MGEVDFAVFLFVALVLSSANIGRNESEQRTCLIKWLGTETQLDFANTWNTLEVIYELGLKVTFGMKYISI